MASDPSHSVHSRFECSVACLPTYLLCYYRSLLQKSTIWLGVLRFLGTRSDIPATNLLNLSGSAARRHLVSWNVLRARKYLPADTTMYLTHDGVKEMRGPEIKDTRDRVYRLLDPFNMTGKNGLEKAGWCNIEHHEVYAL